MPNDTYGRLAARYDRMLRENPARDAFFLDLFTKHGVKRVLDCACGTGRDLIAFAKMGFEVEGSDLSEAMLAQAGCNLSEAGVDAPLRRVDFRELDKHFTPSSFDAVVCLSNSINELLDDADVVTALRAMRAVLRPGGIVVIDQGQTDASMKNPPRYDVVVNEPDFTRVLLMTYDDNIMTVRIVDIAHDMSDTYSDDELAKLLSERSRESECFITQGRELSDWRNSKDLDAGKLPAVHLKIRLRADWERLINQAGYAGVKFYGSWDGAAYGNRAGRLTAVTHPLASPKTVFPESGH